MNTPQNPKNKINYPIYKILSTRCVNCVRCQNRNRRMYIISSMEVLVSLVVIRHSLSLHWPGFSSHHFVKGVYRPTKCWCPYVRTYSKNSQFKFENPIPTHFTLFGVLWTPRSDTNKNDCTLSCLLPSARWWHGTSWESRWSLFIHADSYYEMFIQVMKGHGIIGPRRAQGGTLC
jgi:hypothetical protein